MALEEAQQPTPDNFLNSEQEALLDLYLQNLDRYLEELRASERIQVEIETQHLKKILTK